MVSHMRLMVREMVFVTVVAYLVRWVQKALSISPDTLLHGLTWYMPPSDTTLRELAKVPGLTKKQQERAQAQESSLMVPRQAPFELRPRTLEKDDLLGLFLHELFHHFVFVVSTAFVIFASAEAFYLGTGYQAVAVPLWSLVGAVFAVSNLLSIHYHFSRPEQLSALAIAVAATLLCLALLYKADRVLDFPFEDAYSLLAGDLTAFVERVGLEISSVPPMRVWAALLAATAGVLAAITVFPSHRMSTSHLYAVRANEDRPARLLLLHGSVVLQGLVVLSWLKPVASTTFAHSGLSRAQFDSGRFSLVVAACVVQLLNLRPLMQAFYDSVHQRVRDLAVTPPGGKARIPALLVKTKVYQIAKYSCVAALQFLSLPCLVLFLAALMRSKGQFGRGPQEDSNEDASGGGGRGSKFVLSSQVCFGFLAWWCSTAQLSLHILWLAMERVAVPSGPNRLE